MNNILSGSWWWWQSVNSNLTAPTSSHVSAAAKYRLTVHNRPTAGPDPVTKKPSDSDFWCQKITKLYHHKLSTQFCQCQPVMTVSTKTKHTKATISNPNPTHSACNTLHNSTIFIKICTLVAWMELDYVLCVACGSGTVMLQHWLRRLAFCECPPESPMKCPRPPQFTCQHQALHITERISSVHWWDSFCINYFKIAVAVSWMSPRRAEVSGGKLSVIFKIMKNWREALFSLFFNSH